MRCDPRRARFAGGRVSDHGSAWRERLLYNWSSPTVVGGHIYIGLSSQCDDPLIRGGVVELDQHTGKVLQTWYSVPAGSIGASVWSSVAATADGTRVWATTGNDCGPTLDACPQGHPDRSTAFPRLSRPNWRAETGESGRQSAAMSQSRSAKSD